MCGTGWHMQPDLWVTRGAGHQESGDLCCSDASGSRSEAVLNTYTCSDGLPSLFQQDYTVRHWLLRRLKTLY